VDAPSPQDVQLAAVAGLLAPLLLDVDGAAAALSDNPLLTGKTVRRRAAPMHSISQARLDPVSRGWNARRSPWCTRRSCSSSSSRRATPAGWACSGGERARSSPARAVPGRAAARTTLRCARRRAREIPAEVKTLKAQLPKPVEGQEVTSPLTGQIAALEQARRPPAVCLCARRTPWVQACVPALRPPVPTLPYKPGSAAGGRQERKDLMKDNPREKHNNWGSLLLGLGVAIAVEGPVNTYLRTGAAGAVPASCPARALGLQRRVTCCRGCSPVSLDLHSLLAQYKNVRTASVGHAVMQAQEPFRARQPTCSCVLTWGGAAQASCSRARTCTRARRSWCCGRSRPRWCPTCRRATTRRAASTSRPTRSTWASSPGRRAPSCVHCRPDSEARHESVRQCLHTLALTL